MMPAVIVTLACEDTGQADQVAAAIAETGTLTYADRSGTVALAVTDVTVDSR